MRIATLILGLVLGAILFVQTFLVDVLSGAPTTGPPRTPAQSGCSWRCCGWSAARS